MRFWRAVLRRVANTGGEGVDVGAGVLRLLSSSPFVSVNEIDDHSLLRWPHALQRGCSSE